MIQFKDLTDVFEIDMDSQETDALTSRGDAYMTIQVQSHGFSGHNDFWVTDDALQRFCTGLVNLEKSRQGEARLEGISPEELDIRVYSIDHSGHMAIQGKTGYHVQRSNGLFWHAVHFGFDFDPSQLASAVKEDWVQRNANPCR